MDSLITNITNTLSDTIKQFEDKVPAVQKLLFDQLQPMIKELETANGRLVNNIGNLKLVAQIQAKVQKIITSSIYKDEVQKFIDSYDLIAQLQAQYFAQFIEKYTPHKVLPYLKQMAIEQTINDLIGAGMKDNIVTPIRDILNQNITTGGSYADFNNELRDWIIGNDQNEGNILKYTRQITTDAIQQYSAQYHEIIATDLKFYWFQYVGSLIETSRELCIYLVKKRWIYKDELPEVVKGHIDGHNCRLSKTTGLPYGMIPGTNADNFKVRRGGYNCEHQLYAVPDNVVPSYIRLKSISVRNLMKNAKKSGPEVDKAGKDLSKEFKGSVTPVNYKSYNSIKRKADNELGGNVGAVKDAVRSTIVVQYKDLNKVVDELKTDKRFSRVKVQDGPAYFGYKGVITNFTTKNGTVAEIQVNSPGMIYAKEPKEIALTYMDANTYNSIATKTGLPGGQGHLYYEEIRQINVQTATPEQLTLRDDLIKKSEKYYANFYGF